MLFAIVAAVADFRLDYFFGLLCRRLLILNTEEKQTESIVAGPWLAVIRSVLDIVRNGFSRPILLQ
jgi:hypothetical protein